MAGAAKKVLLRIGVLGPLQVEVDGKAIELRRIEARLLLSLAWNPGVWIPHNRLSEQVYFDAAPRDTTSWRSLLRQTLGPAAAAIETRRGSGTRLNLGASDITTTLDVGDFNERRLAGEDDLRNGNDNEALRAFRSAEDLWRDPVPFLEIAEDVERYAGIVALQANRRSCRQAVVRLSIDGGEFEAALPALRIMSEEDPTDQATIAHLMRASAALGNPTLASEHYDRLCRLLRSKGETPTAAVAALHGAILRDELVQQPNRPTPLGIDLTTFVGREHDVKIASNALSTSRLVSLVGPPGVGKSRLARELARLHADRTTVRPIQLAACHDGSEVAVRNQFAAEFGLSQRSGTAILDELARLLAAQPTLVVIDNCEHVIEALTVVLVGLFSRLDSMHVLATSREPLGIPGEIVQRISPLPLQIEDGTSPAIEMCLDRVKSAGGDLDDLAALHEICQELDGLPLAIELIAPEIAVAGIDMSLQRLRSGALPASARGQAGSRHPTLGAAIESSFERLPEDESLALMAAAGFCTEIDAAALAETTGTSPNDAGELLISLAAKSLIQPSTDSGWFSSFEVVRRFARQAAVQSGNADRLDKAHAQWVRNQALNRDTLTPRLRAEAAQALRWATSAPPADGLEVVDGLRYHLYLIESPPGLVEWLAALREDQTRLGSAATELWATCAFFQGMYGNLERLAHDTLERVQSAGERHRLARAYVLTAFSFAASGDYPAAAHHASRAEALAQECGDRWAFGWAASIDGYQSRRQRDFDRARSRAHEALERFDGMDYPQGKAFPMYTLAIADYRELDDATRALQLLAIGIQQAVSGSDLMMEASGRLFCAQIHAEQGAIGESSHALIRTLVCLRESPHWNLIVSAFEYAAVLLSSHGDLDAALHLTSVAAHARWKNRAKTTSRSIPFLPPQVAEPLLALPQRPDPKFMISEPLATSMDRAVEALERLDSAIA